VVLIGGEAGIGNSRLTAALLERVASEPHTCLRYFCSPHRQDIWLYPNIAHLERAARSGRQDTDEQRLSKLEAVLAQGPNDLSLVVPLLAELLSIPTGDRSPPLNLTPPKRKEKTFYAQLQVEGLAAHQPVLVVWEDIQWSDPTTRESLDLLIDRVPALRVLVIITCRPEFTPPWVGRPHVTLLSLRRLSPGQRTEMILQITAGKSLPKEIADQIVDRTDGIPLFIEELTKSVVESGIVSETGNRYTITHLVAPPAIPTTLHASLLARLDLNCLAEASQIIETTEERISEAALHRMRGELFDAIGDQTAAEQSYDQALAVAARQRAKLFELGAATSLARLWRSQGKYTEARDLLAPLYSWFTAGFDTLDLKEAKALLEQFNA
jgi:predicted ATPase